MTRPVIKAIHGGHVITARETMPLYERPQSLVDLCAGF